MPRTAICHWSQFHPADGDCLDRPISFRLLARPTLPGMDEVAGFEAIARNVCHSSGVCRTTYRGRLLEVDRLVHPALLKLADAGRPLALHDWAVSDGLAASEWAREILDAFPQAHFTASDLDLFLVELPAWGQGAYIFERDGTPLQYVRPPFAVALRTVGNGAGMLARWARPWAARARRLWRRRLAAPPGAEPESVVAPLRALSLIHPEAHALQRQSSRFQILSHSVFDQLSHPVDVIRTMNILNVGYFQPSTLGRATEAVFRSLRPGGLWVVGRTTQVGEPLPPRLNQVSLLRRDTQGFTVLERLRGGSEIEPTLRELGWLSPPPEPTPSRIQ